MAREKKSDPSVRITTQFRSGKSMVYEFSCESTRLTVEIVPNEQETGAFTAAAHARGTPEPPIVTEPGATRGKAFRAVGLAWTAKNEALGFPKVDWDLVGQALVAVHAIEPA